MVTRPIISTSGSESPKLRARLVTRLDALRRVALQVALRPSVLVDELPVGDLEELALGEAHRVTLLARRRELGFELLVRLPVRVVEP